MPSQIVKTNLGHVSAYAIAKANGFQGTEEEWSQGIANAGINGKLAKDAKLDAEAARDRAESAQTASEAAQSAAEAAQAAAEAAQASAESAAAGLIAKESTFIHTQAVASAEWTIQHNLDKYPSVTVVDSAGSVVIGDCQYTSRNAVVLTFNGGFSGKAYLN